MRRNKKMMRLTTPVLAIAGLLAISLPNQPVAAVFNNDPVSTSYNNNYRVCAARLLSAGVSPEATGPACASVLRPREFSACVLNIRRQTQIAAAETITPCRYARRPEDLATCVVGISRYTRETVNPAILDYCGRSLLPVSFARCVVGLRSEVDLAPTQAMDTCIGAGDPIINPLPSFIPVNNRPTEFRPTYETEPAPTDPVAPNTTTN